MCVQTPRVCFSVSSLYVCSTSVHVCEWERCAQSNYVIRAEPSGHLCGRALQLAKDSLLDFVSLLLCVCVTGHHMDGNYRFLVSVSALL